MGLVTQNLPFSINGDTVIGYTNGVHVRQNGWQDLATLTSWYRSNPDDNHLGMINLFELMGERTVPVYKNFFKNRAILEVNGMNGSVTYEIGISKKKKGVYITESTSNFSEAPGIGGSLFPVKLNEEFRPGDILGYDSYRGAQFVVSEDKPIEREGDSFVHWVTLVDADKGKWFPTDKLQAGVEYFKIGHSLGEFSTQFSGISGFETPDTIKCEFVLGNHRGVEVAYTMYAHSKSFSGASVSTREYIGKWMDEASKIGVDSDGRALDMFYFGKATPNGIDTRTIRIGTVLEKLAILENIRLEAYSLMFQKGALITDINGTKRLNEGFIPQARRGRVYKYSRPGGISIKHLKMIADYIYRFKTDVPIKERKITLKGGRMAVDNVHHLIQYASINSLQNLAQFNGFERVLPKSPVEGSSLTDLRVNPVEFSEACFPGVGWVKVEHDPSLDYQPLVDRRSAGFFGPEGLPDSSYSIVVYDAMEESGVDASKVVKGASVMKGGSNRANVYYVKPEGEGLYMGYSEGRWSPNKASDIVSSMKEMARSFWVHSISACLILDPSRMVLLELDR